LACSFAAPTATSAFSSATPISLDLLRVGLHRCTPPGRLTPTLKLSRRVESTAAAADPRDRGHSLPVDAAALGGVHVELEHERFEGLPVSRSKLDLGRADLVEERGAVLQLVEPLQPVGGDERTDQREPVRPVLVERTRGDRAVEYLAKSGQLMATTLLRGLAGAALPKNGALPKVNTPPSAATSV
jgi:hypothetical protein